MPAQTSFCSNEPFTCSPCVPFTQLHFNQIHFLLNFKEWHTKWWNFYRAAIFLKCLLHLRDYGENQLNLPNLHKYYVDFPGLIITLIPHSDLCNQTWRVFISEEVQHVKALIYWCRFGFATDFSVEINHLKQTAVFLFYHPAKVSLWDVPIYFYRLFHNAWGEIGGVRTQCMMVLILNILEVLQESPLKKFRFKDFRIPITK